MANINYESRFWQKLYDPGLPSDIKQKYGDTLSAFRSIVQKYPESSAVLFFDGKLTFRSVDELSDRMARAFLDEGLNVGDRVVQVLQNVPQFVLVLLAAWKVGAIVVPVNPMYKSKEFEFVLDDCEPAIVVVQEDFYRLIAEQSLKTRDTSGDLQPSCPNSCV